VTIRILHGDCLALLSHLDANSVQCCVTSPPYFGLRDYGTGTWLGGDADCDHIEVQPELAERCIKAGSGEGDTVLDPFSGAGTTALVADRLRRRAIGIELNPNHAALGRDRIIDESPLFAQVAAQ
jgi:DNA modification methylase